LGVLFVGFWGHRGHRDHREKIKEIEPQISLINPPTADKHRFCLTAENAESTEGLRRRCLQNALGVIAESVLDTSPPKADKVSAVSFLAPTLGWVLPAGSEVKRIRHRRINWWDILNA
jgi:hypothetical protein